MARKSPLSLVKEKFGDKDKLVEAVKAFITDDLCVKRTSEDRGRDFSMCVKATAALGLDVSVSVNVQFGTFKRGITPDAPVVRFISVSREDDLVPQLEKLSDLSARLAELLSK